MYIYAFSNHSEQVHTALSNKKIHLKKKVNRSDNFVNLTLLGAEKCMESGYELNENTNIYIASDNGNMNTTLKVLKAIFIEHKLPMPFNFLNSVNASILFLVAKRFDIQGKAIFVDTFESALLQAYVDVKKGNTVLLGVVNEAIEDLEMHRERFGDSSIKENSRWLILSPKNKEIKALAKVDNMRVKHTQQSTGNSEMFFSFLEQGEGILTYQNHNIECELIKLS